MSSSAIIVHDGDESYRLLVTHRDWGLLWGPGFFEGPLFSKTFGVYDNFTVAGGIPRGSQVKRRGDELFVAAAALLAAIERDGELLRYDYSYGFAGDPARYGGGRSIRVRGMSGILWARPKGYCYVELKCRDEAGPPRVVEVIDLRVDRAVQTESGLVKSYRRKAAMNWLETLPPLLEFLQSRRDKELAVEHQDRVAEP
jgi:hypothetical protein